MGELRVLSLFSGIGAYEKSLENLGVPHKVVNYCEINKYASKAYSTIHNVPEEKNLWDVVNIKETDIKEEIDLMSWSFPCQSISLSGKKDGFFDKEGNLTSSGLYYEGYRILKMCKPKYSIIENVKPLTGPRFKKEFEIILEDLDKAGYNTYWFVCDAADYGLAQQRERVYIISIRKDIDNNSFILPGKRTSILPKLKDFLIKESEVANKYYLKGKVLDSYKEREVINTKTKIISIGQTSNKGSQAGKVYSIEGVFPTLCAGTHGYANGYIKVNNKLRKLLPVEFARLMGFDDEDIKICQEIGISDTQIYRMLGNSVVVPILEEIFINLGVGDRHDKRAI